MINMSNMKNVKRILLATGLFFFTGIVFALDVNATSYSGVINNGTVLINGGIGFGSSVTGLPMKMPPLLVSAEYALPLFTLPWTLGGVIGMSMEEAANISSSIYSIGARIAYHISIGVPQLDTYIATNIGGTVCTNSYTNNIEGKFLFAFYLGGRYFFKSAFPLGVFLEVGGGTHTHINFGATLRL
ncbi:MAG: hypothetical protein LBT01_01860 [Spirochaetaceae bacterium]|jgi:uncharacterized membrane protein YqaE (UPF0057 family)|nr:hypothetical protein [Spirochaetaceae bacterium]